MVGVHFENPHEGGLEGTGCYRGKGVTLSFSSLPFWLSLSWKLESWSQDLFENKVLQKSAPDQ